MEDTENRERETESVCFEYFYVCRKMKFEMQLFGFLQSVA